MGDVATTVELLTRGGLVTALILALIGGMRGWYVWRGVHESAIKGLSDQLVEMKTDRNYWRDQAVRAMTVGGKVASIAESTVQKSGE